MLTVFKYLIANVDRKVIFINLCDGSYFARHKKLIDSYLNSDLPEFESGHVRHIKDASDEKGNLLFIEAEYNDEITPKVLDGKIIPFEIEQMGFL